MEFAKRGFNVALISRTKIENEKIAADIKQKYPEVEVKTIQHDFMKHYSAEDYEKLYETHLKDLDIGILHNNASSPGDTNKPFHEMDDKKVHDATVSNLYPKVLLTQQVIKSFKKRY